MSSDPTEAARQQMLAKMPDELEARVKAGEVVWDTAALQEEFTVLSYAAPLVIVRRKADGAMGSLMFTHSPRFYFGWVAEDE